MEGFIRLSRSFFDNKIWQAARAFSECEAWLDLIQSARFDASPTTSCIGSCEVTWDRGQYPASIRFLSKKWGRSERWVRTFLDKLKKERMISIDNGQGVNVITLINFDKYNDSGYTTANTVSTALMNEEDIQAIVSKVIAQYPIQVNSVRNTSDTPVQNSSLERHTPDAKTKKDKERDSLKEISLTRDKEKTFLAEEELGFVTAKSLDECKKELLNSPVWLEDIVRNTYRGGRKDFTLEVLTEYIERFFAKLQNEGETSKSPKDAKSHFANWLRIELNRSGANSCRFFATNEALIDTVDIGSAYGKFLKLVKDNAPYCFANMKMPTEEQVLELKHVPNGSARTRDALMQIENNVFLRSKRELLYYTIKEQLKYMEKHG